MLKVRKSWKKKFDVFDSPKKWTLGHFLVHKNDPEFVFLENQRHHIFFRDLLTFSYSSYLRQSQGLVGNSTSLLQIYVYGISTLQSWNCSVQSHYVCLDLRIYECGSIILQYVVWYFGTVLVCFVIVCFEI